MVHRFNLSEWALAHQSLVLYFMIVLAVVGVGSYLRLGQAEDPDFTFKLMVVRTNWPGASADEVERQLTDRIEKKLQETPRLDHLRSYSKPGESVIFVFVKDSSRPDEIKDTWYQVRKKVGDIRAQLPAGIQGPFFNDEFGDTFGNIYALTGDGFSYAQLKESADRIRADLLRVKDVAKVELIGEQDEKIFVEIANAKLATLGVEPAVVFAALAQQNAVASSGSFETATDRLYIRTTGALDSVESVRALPVRANGRLFRLGDIATVSRGFSDPPQPKIRFMGRDALGIAVSMASRGDIIALGEALDAEVARVKAELPVGVELDRVNDQPAAVKRSVERVHAHAGGGRGHRPAGELPVAGAEDRAHRGAVHPAHVRGHVPLHVPGGHRPAQGVAGRAHHRAGPAGGRRHHLRRDDGREDGAGLGARAGRELRLHLHRHADAHRHRGDRGRVPAHRPRALLHRRVHVRDVRRDHDRAPRLLGGVRPLRPLPGLQAAAGLPPRGRARGRGRGLPQALLPALPPPRRVERGATAGP